MIRSAASIFTAALFLAGAPAVYSDDAKPAPQASIAYFSPQEAFDGWRAAIEKHDWRTAFLSETPPARDADVFDAYFGCAMKVTMKRRTKLSAVLEKFGVDDASGRITTEYNRRYMDKHGVDIGKLKTERQAREDKLVAEFFKKRAASGVRDDPDVAVPTTIDESQLGPPLPPDDNALLRSAVVDSISDKLGFYAAVHDILDSDRPANPRIGPLERITIKGDAAEGTATATTFVERIGISASGVQTKAVDCYDSKETFRFAKTANGWLRD
jgi:hypothetical protein